MFPIRNGLKQGDALSPLLFNFALEGSGNPGCFKLNCGYQLLFLVHADDVNVLGGSVHAIKENPEALVMDSKEIGLETNADETKYMVVSLDQNAAQSHSMKIDNSFFESVEEFIHSGTILSIKILLRKN
jgi:hypothetical protein